MGALEDRMARLGSMVQIAIVVPQVTAIRLGVIAKQRGLSEEEAVAEAVRDWTLKGEQRLHRSQRLELQRQLNEARERSLNEMGEDFERQMRDFASQPLTRLGTSGIDISMGATKERTLRERRETLGLSRERLAREANISSPAIEQFEGGFRPTRSEALVTLEATLDRLEQEATAA